MKTGGENNRLRIAVLIRHFTATGGTERYCVEVTRRLAAAHEVHVFAQIIDDRGYPGVHFHPITLFVTKPRWVNQWLFSWATQKATRGKFDIVHSHDMVTDADVYTLHVPCFLSNYKSVPFRNKALAWLTTIASPRKLAYLLLEHRQISERAKPKRFIAVSRFMANNLAKHYPHARSHISIAYPGISVEAGLTQPPGHREQLRKRAGVPSETFVILFVANDFRKKGLDTLLKAVALLKERHVLLLVVGNGDRKAYGRLVNSLGIQDRVRWLGIQCGIQDWLLLADALAHPTLTDTYGMVVLEAMALGLPVIVSSAAYCGAAGQFTSHQALMIQDPHDSHEIAHYLRALIDDPALRRTLAESGRQFARERTWEATASATLAAYRVLLEPVSAMK